MINLDLVLDDDRLPGPVTAVALPERSHRADDRIDNRPEHLLAFWREQYEERAAIREFHGNQARGHAEAEALQEIVEHMRASPADNN